ncbi:MAG: hypothetical protein QMD53_06860 [Actinomycetota bacterium]|nr:hypothetical protein [Actinomycetota bacterium]
METKSKFSESSVLGIIYTLVLAAILAVFVGIALNTFYPAPEYSEYPREELVQYGEDNKPLTEKDRANEKINNERRVAFEKEVEKHEVAYKEWMAVASIVIFIAATLLVALGLFQSGKVHILPNGILLGGFFTLLYGVGLGLASQSRYLIFFVTSASLVVILAAGYLKFVRPERLISKN